MQTEPIIESKSMHMIFQKKGKKGNNCTQLTARKSSDRQYVTKYEKLTKPPENENMTEIIDTES